MTVIHLTGTLTASDTGKREITGLMLPYGEVGHTSAGPVTASAGSVSLPDDPSVVKLNLEHDFTRPVGTAVSFTDTDEGIVATFRVAKTSAGNDLLEEVRDGLRAALSVEITDPVIEGDALTAGQLSGCAAVVRPAFANAQITDLAASAVTNEAPSGADKESLVTENLNAPEQEQTPVQAAPLSASSEKRDLGAIAFNALSTGENLNAALNVILPSNDDGKVYIKDQEVGELWEARKSERPIVERVGVKNLTSLVVTGNRRTRVAKMQDWQGSPTLLPTMEVQKTSREYWNAEAKAGAVRIAMEVVEFGGQDAVSDLLADAHADYIRESESELVADLKLEATAVTGTGTLASVSAAIQQLGRIGARADVIAVAPDVFGELIEMKASELPFWFNNGSASLHGQTVNAGDIFFTTSQELEAGEILVFDTRAVDYRESKDFTYRAVDIATAGTDVAAVKFRATKVTDPAAVILIDTAAPAGA